MLERERERERKIERERERENLTSVCHFRMKKLFLISFQIMYYFSLKYDSIIFIIISFLSTLFSYLFFFSAHLFLNKGTVAIHSVM